MSESATWYVRKPYPHFDLPLSEKSAVAYVCDPDKVVQHAFHPFITYKLLTPRFRKDPQTKKVVRDPLTGYPINKPKERLIAYPSHRDGYIFSYYKSLLAPLYEQWLKTEGLNESVTAFRSIGENNVTLAKKAFDFIKSNPVCQIIAVDVEGFFDNIDHQELKKIWARFLHKSQLPDDHYAVYKGITRYGVVEKHEVYGLFGVSASGRLKERNAPVRICTPQQFREKVIPRKLVQPALGRAKGIGIPQGSSLSPLLSNIYMADLDSAMHSWITSLGGRYWRYCDDILIVTPDSQGIDILACFDEHLNRLKLSRNKEKTQIQNSDELPHKPLQYLGFLFNGNKITIRPSSIHRYHRKLKKAVQAARFHQKRESLKKLHEAPFRKQALYNMYSELPLRGKKIKLLQGRKKYQGNFTHYMDRSAKIMKSPAIKRQRKKVLKLLRLRLARRF